MMREWDWTEDLTITMPRFLWDQVINALEHQQQDGIGYDGMTDGEPLADWQQDRLNLAIDAIVNAWKS